MTNSVNLANLASQMTAPGSQITLSQSTLVTGAQNTFTGSMSVSGQAGMFAQDGFSYGAGGGGQGGDYGYSGAGFQGVILIRYTV